MALVLTEEQQMIQDSAKGFLAEHAAPAELRRLRDSNDELGYNPQVWQQMVELGWTAMAIPEAYGGLAFGYTGLGLVLEEMGKNLSQSPLEASVLVSATLMNLAACEEDKQYCLPKIANGEWRVSLAGDEAARHNPNAISMSAVAANGGYLLNGVKCAVLDAQIADHFIVAARTSGQAGDESGISLFMVAANTAGIEVERIQAADSRNLGIVTFNEVQANYVLGDIDQAYPVLQKGLAIANIGLSAQLLGVAQQAFDMTVEYLKERKQFGFHIGSFQGLQHRAADMLCELDMCRSLVLKALQAIDADAENLGELASATKAKLSQVAKQVTCEAVQMHGGIGMTDEFDIGFYLKRAQALIHTFGDSAYHLNRYAQLRAF